MSISSCNALNKFLPKNDRRRDAKLDQNLLDILVQSFLVKVPRRLVVGRGARRGVRRPADGINRGWLRTQQFIQQPLGRRQDLLGQLADQVLGELLELVSMEAGE